MRKVYDKCCGVDVHKKLLVACLVVGGKREVREFGATTRELLAMADWLSGAGCEMAAMESTGSYWKPLYNVLECAGLPAMVVNAQHVKNVPGRKTDVRDAEWLADLLQHGLLNASFIPSRPQRELRELLSYRRSLVADRAREVNRLQKVLEGGNIKLSGTVSNIVGMSGRALLDAALSGARVGAGDIARMREEGAVSRRLKASDEQLADDLEGVLSGVQRRIIREILGHVDELDAHIAAIDEEVDSHMDDGQKAAAEAISGIPGMGETSARAVIAVIGTDMSRFPTAGHLASWAGLCPGDNESAGKRKSGKTRKGNKLLQSTLVNAAHSAVRRKDSYFAAQFKRISAHRGKKRAYVAVAHSMLVAIYHVLAERVAFKDLGADYYSKFNRERKARSYIKKLCSLGYRITAVPTA